VVTVDVLKKVSCNYTSAAIKTISYWLYYAPIYMDLYIRTPHTILFYIDTILLLYKVILASTFIISKSFYYFENIIFTWFDLLQSNNFDKNIIYFICNFFYVFSFLNDKIRTIFHIPKQNNFRKTSIRKFEFKTTFAGATLLCHYKLPL